MWRFEGQLHSLRLHYTAEMQRECALNSVHLKRCPWDWPLWIHISLQRQISCCVVFRHYLILRLFEFYSLISACGCTIQTSSLFSNLLSNRSLIYLSAGVRGKTLFLLNCDCSKSSGRENNSITLKHWELSQRPVICFRAPDFSCRH